MTLTAVREERPTRRSIRHQISSLSSANMTTESPSTLRIPGVATMNSSIHTISFSDDDDSSYHSDSVDEETLIFEADTATFADDLTMEMSEFSRFVSKRLQLEDCESLGCPRSSYRPRSFEDAPSVEKPSLDKKVRRQQKYRQRYENWKKRHNLCDTTTDEDTMDGGDSLSLSLTIDSLPSTAQPSTASSSMHKSTTRSVLESIQEPSNCMYASRIPTSPQTIPGYYCGGTTPGRAVPPPARPTVSLPAVSEHPSDEVDEGLYKSFSNSYEEDYDDVGTCASELTWEHGDNMGAQANHSTSRDDEGYEVPYSQQRERTNSGVDPDADISLASSASDDSDDDLSRKLSIALGRSRDPSVPSSKSSNSRSIATSQRGDAAEPIDVTDIESVSEYALASQGSSHLSRLSNVHYVARMDEASSHRELSTVEAMSPQEARAAFDRKVPQTIPIEDNIRDDISSLGSPIKMSRFGALRSSLCWPSRSKRQDKSNTTSEIDNEAVIRISKQPVYDEEAPTLAQMRPAGPIKDVTDPSATSSSKMSNSNASQPSYYQKSNGSNFSSSRLHEGIEVRAVPVIPEKEPGILGCINPRSDLELFFVALIAVSILTLVVLLALIVSQN